MRSFALLLLVVLGTSIPVPHCALSGTYYYRVDGFAYFPTYQPFPYASRPPPAPVNDPVNKFHGVLFQEYGLLSFSEIGVVTALTNPDSRLPGNSLGRWKRMKNKKNAFRFNAVDHALSFSWPFTSNPNGLALVAHYSANITFPHNCSYATGPSVAIQYNVTAAAGFNSFPALISKAIAFGNGIYQLHKYEFDDDYYNQIAPFGPTPGAIPGAFPFPYQ